MTIDKITDKQRTNAQNDFLDWAIKHNDLDLIDSLSSIPQFNQTVEPFEFRINNVEINKLYSSGTDLQNVIFEMIEIHNNDFSNIPPDDYMWNTHYTESLSLIRGKIKRVILNVAKEISRKCNQKDNAWLYYLKKFNSLFYQLCDFEKKHNGCILLFRPFNQNFITAVLLELNKNSPLHNQSRDIVEMFMPYFKKYEIRDIIEFNNPFEKWLQEKSITIDKNIKIGLIDDLMEMRSLFFKNWDADKHRISINDQFDGIIDVRCATPSLTIVGKNIGITDRLGFDTISWCFYTGEAFFNSNFFIAYGLNADYLLELLHNYLVTLFSMTNVGTKKGAFLFDDSDKILYEHLEFNPGNESIESVDELSLFPERKTTKFHIPKVRQSRLFLWLKEHLGCNILSGKGSEIKIFHPGGRIYTIGKHKQDPEVSPWKVKEILKRVCIEEEVWHPLVKHL